MNSLSLAYFTNMLLRIRVPFTALVYCLPSIFKAVYCMHVINVGLNLFYLCEMKPFPC